MQFQCSINTFQSVDTGYFSPAKKNSSNSVTSAKVLMTEATG